MWLSVLQVVDSSDRSNNINWKANTSTHKTLYHTFTTRVHVISDKTADPSEGVFPKMTNSRELNEILGKYKRGVFFFFSRDKSLPYSSLHNITLNDNTPVFQPNFPLSHDVLSKLTTIVEEIISQG